uniref:Thioesterase domain-containing protein n=1 Tax=Aegilops tauschii TaxID=37682 RepID=N1R5Q4_AEGTA
MERWHDRSLGHRLYDAFTVAGLRVEAIVPGRLLCSFMAPPRLTSRHAASTQEEIEIEARVLGMGDKTGCVTVEVRRKDTDQVLAHGRHTKYLANVSSKL